MASGLQVPPLPGYKKRRLQGACDICKHKKIRCDSAQMPGGRCSNCIAFDSECTHFNAKKRGSSHRLLKHDLTSVSKPTTALRTLSTQGNLDIPPRMDDSQSVTHALVQSILSSSNSDGLNDISTLRQALASLAQHALSLEQELSNLKECPIRDGDPDNNTIPEASAIPTISANPSTNDGVDIALSESLKRLTIKSWHNRFFGPSSIIMLVRTAIEMQNASNGGQTTDFRRVSSNIRPTFWTRQPWEYLPSEPPSPQHFPDSDLLKHLTQLFFDNINIHIPLLHRPTFERSIRDHLHLTDHQFGDSVLAVCAVAARYSNDPRTILEGTDSSHSRGWKWFRQINPLQKPPSQAASVYDLQTYLLSVVFLQGSATPDGTWTLVGVGVRYAQDVGVHRRRSNRKPSVEDELWKRAFWVLICFDTTLSSFLGRPRATNSKDYDLDLPTDCDDEYWEITDKALTFKQPPGKPSRIASFISYLKLIEILDAAQRTIYSVKKSTILLERPWDEHRIVTELDSELNKWVDSVPDHLRWDPQNQDLIFFEQSAMLYAAYYNIQMLVHRPFINAPTKPSSLPFPSLAICTNAARSCIHLMELVSRRGFVFHPHILMALFSSGVVLLLNVWAGKLSGFHGDPGKDVQAVVDCINVMHAYENRFPSAGRMCDTVGELSAAGGIQLPFVCTTKGESYQEHGGTEFFSAEGKEQASPELYTAPQELSSLMDWPLYSADLGRLPDYRPFDGSMVGEEYWYQRLLHHGFTNHPEHGNPFGDAFGTRDNSSAIPLNWTL